jgi:hypothetical protein
MANIERIPAMMSERDIEDLIATYPSEFFPGKGLRLKGRQQALAGVGRFDLLFEDRYKRQVLMELKARNLKYQDATQVAEYKDALEERGVKRLVMWLVAPRIPIHVRDFLDDVGIEYSEIHKGQFQEVAKRHGFTFRAEGLAKKMAVTSETTAKPVKSAGNRIQRKKPQPYDEWPDIAKAVNKAGQELRRKFGDRIRRSDIQDEAARSGRWKRTSIMPSDYCYNRRNKDARSNRWNVFIWNAGGSYQYVGPNYSYKGPVIEEPLSKRNQPH